jgi:hypothetical protein
MNVFFEQIDESQVQNFYNGYTMRLKEVLNAKGQITRY